jgi:hypothetical protein
VRLLFKKKKTESICQIIKFEFPSKNQNFLELGEFGNFLRLEDFLVRLVVFYQYKICIYMLIYRFICVNIYVNHLLMCMSDILRNYQIGLHCSCTI